MNLLSFIEFFNFRVDTLKGIYDISPYLGA